ncbi:lipoprotein [Enterovibrio paralichthyis]|uniref:lipoprotein n=1 Tax=Enterovibrio paralichthyis TaxID=2853805 RepID=UPI0006D0EB78|nr:lipoprotein [Enterovibrio paralichthyis]MBV7296891.1 lipoprotein [Enterovibrio paralichthyis]
MKRVLLLAGLTLVLGGCSSIETAESMPNPDQRVVDSRLNISSDLNATYCEGAGFEKFMEREKYYTFTCKDGSFFNIAK